MGTYGYYEAELTFANKELAEIFWLGFNNEFWNVTKQTSWIDGKEVESDTVFLLTGDGKMYDFTSEDPKTLGFYDNMSLDSSLAPHPWKFWKHAKMRSYSYEYTQEDLCDRGVLNSILTKLDEGTKKVIQAFHKTDDDVCIDLLSEFIDCKELGYWGFFQNEHMGDYCDPWGYIAEWDGNSFHMYSHDHHWDWRSLEKDYAAYLMELLPQQTSSDAFDGNHHA